MKIKLTCRNCGKSWNIEKTEDVPENATGIICNYCSYCEFFMQEDYKEEYIF